MSIAPNIRLARYKSDPPPPDDNFDPPLQGQQPWGHCIIAEAWNGARNHHQTYRSVDQETRRERSGMMTEIAANWSMTAWRLGIPYELQPNLPPHPLDWSNVLLVWALELSRLTRGDHARAMRLLHIAPMERGGPEAGFLSSDDVWRATVLCEREDAANRVGGIVKQATELCL